MPPVLALVGRTHLLLLHFPIALLFVVLVVELALRRRVPEDRRRPIVGTLLAFTVVGTLAAVGTGLLFGASESWHGHTRALMQQHRTGGLITGVLVVAAGLALWREELHKAFLPLVVAAIVGVSFTGHRGGQLVHGSSYITDALDGVDRDHKRANKDDGGAGDDLKRSHWAEGSAPEKPDYEKDVKPIFERSCVKCHGPEKRKSGLRLDKKRFAMRGGETGLAIVPGDVEKSLLCKYIQLPEDDDDIMPAKGKLLAKSEIETLKRWVEQGASWPDNPR